MNGVDYIDYMWIKFGVILVLAFLAGLFGFLDDKNPPSDD